MKAPQIIMIILLLIDLIGNLVHDGEVKVSTYNFSITAVSTVIFVLLLAWGGFWW